MAEKFTFLDTVTMALGTGSSTHRIASEQAAQGNAPLFQMGVFGVSVTAISGTFGIRVTAVCPNGTTELVAGITALGSAKTFIPNNLAIAGTTWYTGLMRPFAIEYEPVGLSWPSSMSAMVWGVLFNP